jgi:hypothetical protein
MAELLRGTVAPAGGDTETPPRPFRIRASGRLDPDAAQWTRPLPPLLWQRLEPERRQAHERAVETYAQAAARAHELAGKARQQAVDDEAALREAVALSSTVPKPKAPAAEQAAVEARRAQDMAAALVLESGGELAAGFGADDVAAAIAEAKAEAAEIVAGIPEQVDRLLAELQSAGQLGGEVQWCGRLVERRIQGPWTGSSAPLTRRLAAAREAAETLRAHVLAELEDRDWKAAPVEHRAPAGAPPADTWVSSGIDPTR